MRAWNRVPDTLRARVRVENYLRGLGYPRPSFATVLRATRLMEVRGTPAESVSRELNVLHLGHIHNEVIGQLRLRAWKRARVEERAPAKTHRLLADGSLEPLPRGTRNA